MCSQAGVIEEMVNDSVDSALDSEDVEEEMEEEVDKVLTAIAAETAVQLPQTVRKERLKQPAQSIEDAEVFLAYIVQFVIHSLNKHIIIFFPDCVFCVNMQEEGADDEEELNEIRARLAKVRS